MDLMSQVTNSSEEEEVNEVDKCVKAIVNILQQEEVVDEVKLQNELKRREEAFALMSNPKRMKKEVLDILPRSSAYGATMEIFAFRIQAPKEGSSAPFNFAGVVLKDVVVPHSPQYFEKSFDVVHRRDPIEFKKGDDINLSFFSDDAKRVFPENSVLRLSAVTYNVATSNKALSYKGVNEDGQKGDVVYIDKGDVFINFSCRGVSALPTFHEDLYSVLKDCPIQNPEKIKYGYPLEYPQGSSKVLMTVKFSAKTSDEIEVYDPKEIPNEILLTRKYPGSVCFYAIDNNIRRDLSIGMKKDSLIIGLTSIPDPEKPEEYSYKKANVKDAFMAIRGNANGKHLAQMFFCESGKKGIIASSFYEGEVMKLGISTLDIWKNCCSNIILYLSAVCMLKINMNAKTQEDESYEFSLFGSSTFVSIDYYKTYSNAGLKVTMEFAYQILHSLDTKKSSFQVGLKSEFSKFDEFYKKYIEGDENVPVLCLNTFTGDPTKTLLNRDVFCIPCVNDYNFSSVEDLRSIMQEQDFKAKIDTTTNEEFVKKEWIRGNEGKKSKLTFMAVLRQGA